MDVATLISHVDATADRIIAACDSNPSSPLPPFLPEVVTCFQVGPLTASDAASLATCALLAQTRTYGRVLSRFIAFPAGVASSDSSIPADLSIDAHPWVLALRPICVRFRVSALIGALDTVLAIDAQGHLAGQCERPADDEKKTAADDTWRGVATCARGDASGDADIVALLHARDAHDDARVQSALYTIADRPELGGVVRHAQSIIFVPAATNSSMAPAVRHAAISSFCGRFEARVGEAHLLRLQAATWEAARADLLVSKDAGMSACIGKCATWMCGTGAVDVWNAPLLEEFGVHVAFPEHLLRPRSRKEDETGLRFTARTRAIPGSGHMAGLALRGKHVIVKMGTTTWTTPVLQTAAGWTSNSKPITADNQPITLDDHVDVSERVRIAIVPKSASHVGVYLMNNGHVVGVVPCSAPTIAIAVSDEIIVTALVTGELQLFRFTANNEPMAVKRVIDHE